MKKITKEVADIRQPGQRSQHPSALGLWAPVGRALKKNAIMTSPLLVSYQTFPKTDAVFQFTNGKEQGGERTGEQLPFRVNQESQSLFPLSHPLYSPRNKLYGNI